MIRPIQDPNPAQVALPTNINHNNLVESPQQRVDLPQSSPDMRSPQEDAEIRRPSTDMHTTYICMYI